MNMRVQQAQSTSRPEETSKKDSKDDGLMSKLIAAIQMLLQELMKESKKSSNEDQSGSPEANGSGQPSSGDCGNNKPVEPGNKGANQPAPAGGGQSEPVNNAKNASPANAPAGDASKPADATNTPPGNSPAGNAPAGDAGKLADTQDASKTSGMTGPAGGKYDALIEEKANKHGIDADFLKIIVAKESQGNPNAESSAGAVGLGQLKPETASKYAGRQVSKDELKSDVGLNLDCAAGYLADLSKMKGGKLDDVAGSYNQGENSNWREIPESQEYVKTVMQSYENKALPTWG